MSETQNTDNNKWCWVCGATGTLICCWRECKIVQPLLEDSSVVYYKTKHTPTIIKQSYSTVFTQVSKLMSTQKPACECL